MIVITNPGWLLKVEPKICLEHILMRMNSYKVDHSDEIPKEIIHSTAENNAYKCRVAWWAGLHMYFETLIKRDLLSEELKDKQYLIWEKWRQNLKENSRTRIEDIERVNGLLDETINYLDLKIKEYN